MGKKPLVAIAIPIYNTEKYIGECIDHILAQTYQNWICCITDNASTDNSLSTIKKHIGIDPRFIIYQNQYTIPAAENWNISLSNTLEINAKYIKLEPADDWIYPEYLERMIDVLEKDDRIGACFSYRLNGKVVDCNGLDIYDGNIFEGREILIAELTKKYSISGSLGTPLFRIEALKKISANLHVYNINNFHPDTELAHDVMYYNKIGFVFQTLTYIRRHNETETFFASKYNTYLNGWERILYKRLDCSQDIKKEYTQHRLKYACFLVLKFIQMDKKCLKWHMQYLERPITISEYIKCPKYIIKHIAILIKRLNP